MRALDDLYGKQILVQDFAEGGCYRSFLFCFPDSSGASNLENLFQSLIHSSLPAGYPGTAAMQSVLRELQGLAVASRTGVAGRNQ